MQWRRVCYLVVAASFAAIGNTSAQQLVSNVCETAADARRADGPSSPELARAIDQAEHGLAEGTSAGIAAAERALNETAARVHDANAEQSAGFCSALGETARRGAGGGVEHAPTLLRSALESAETAQSPRLAARAAYRLALASFNVGSGGALSRGASDRAPETWRTSSDSAACAAALTPDPSLRGGVNAPMALECAAARAAQAGDIELSGLALLRWTRLRLVAAEASPFAAVLRQMAAQAPLAFLTSPGGARLDDQELRGRLIEAAIDAGAGSDPRTLDALDRVTSSDPEIAAFTEALRARAAHASGRTDQAHTHIQRAIWLESTRSRPERLANWLLLLATFDPAERERHIDDAYRALRAVPPRRLYDSLTEESTFEIRQRPVFEAAIDTTLAGSPDPGRIALAQEIVETYRQAELASVYGDECVPARDPIGPTDLRDDEVVLYPVLLENRVELLYAVNDGQGYRPAQADVAASRASVTALADELYVSVYQRGRGDAWVRPAQELYDLLIAPIEHRLTHADGQPRTLIIVPDGPLRSVPFAALRDRNGRHLVERAPVAVAPALAYAQPARTDARSGRPRVVAASLSQRVGDFPALDSARGEAQAAAAFGNTRSVNLNNFTANQLQQEVERAPVDILHLATHASFGGRSDQSFILSADGMIGLASLREMIQQSRVRGDELDLLVLSACETARGDDAAMMGLAGSAVQSGAVSALASLWPVDDRSTERLMSAFYAAYATSSKAEALRQAQLSLIHAGGRSAEPHYWAAFAMIGGWR